jgi:hypothetical protein
LRGGGAAAWLKPVQRFCSRRRIAQTSLQGYALDALEAPLDGRDPDPVAAAAFLDRVVRSRVSEHDGIGLGRDLRFAQDGVAGAGLVTGDELVQLTAFPESGTGEAGAGTPIPGARIRRPSRRRAS